MVGFAAFEPSLGGYASCFGRVRDRETAENAELVPMICSYVRHDSTISSLDMLATIWTVHSESSEEWSSTW